ncbi:hypothetical protein BGX23_010508 [Mortierella sp. AD031]|nr:hypothetical protein BGX23_010508 [Mortierella sp. AD031]
MILLECAVLETLRLDLKNRDSARPTLLEDAVAIIPWACTKIRHLKLCIGDVTLPLQQKSYYQRPAPIVLSAAETANFSLLERLYRQIGALKDLEHLVMQLEGRYHVPIGS